MLSKANSPTLNQIRSLLPAYVTLFLFSFATPILYLATPIYMEQLFDRVNVSKNMNTLFMLTIIALYLVAMYSVMEFVRGKTLQRVGVAIDGKLSRAFFDALHRERPAAQAAQSSIALTDMNNVRDFLSGPMIGTIFDAIWSPVFILAMFVVHPVLGYTSIVMIVGTALLSVVNRFLVQRDNRLYQAASAKAMDFGAAVARAAEPARAMGMLPALADRWHGLHQAMLGWQMAGSKRTDVVAGIIKFVRNSQMMTTAAIATILFLQGEIGQIGIMIAFTIMLRALQPIDALVSNWRSFTIFSGSLRRLDDLLRASAQETEKVKLPAPLGTLTVSRVFAAPPGSDKLVLNDISFELGQGRVLGVIGPSGAGKSCLARILVGIWRPRRGTVSLGDTDLAHWRQDDLGAHLGYVPQDVDLLPGTAAENIARFDPDATENSEKLIDACERAGIQDFIKGLPEGFNTLLGPGGHTLSGGQKQRLALARALYGSPRLVVLDEPNSNLDVLGEQALGTAVDRLRREGATVVIVTHKVALLSYCDDVLVLNAGSVQAFGTRDQIVNRLPRLKAAPSLTVIEGNAESRRA